MRFYVISVLVLSMVACGSPTMEPSRTNELPTAQVLATTVASPVAPSLPFEPATYRDADAGFRIEYPANWYVIGGETQSRGSYVQIVSWDPGPGGITEIPAGESVLQITIYLWEPTHNLDARVDMRRNNFIDSGNAILEEGELALGEQRAFRFLTQAADGTQGLFFMLELGDRYLELSGSGDIPTLDAAIRTLTIDEPGQ